MPDREKVISGLEHCIPDPNKSLHERMEENECRHAECPYGGKEYERGMGCFWDLMSDALAMLKEQEAEWLEVDDKHDAFDCSNCGAMAGRKCLYCPGCGAKMKNGTRAIEGR